MGVTKKHRIQTSGKQLKICLGEKTVPRLRFKEPSPEVRAMAPDWVSAKATKRFYPSPNIMMDDASSQRRVQSAWSRQRLGTLAHGLSWTLRWGSRGRAGDQWLVLSVGFSSSWPWCEGPAAGMCNRLSFTVRGLLPAFRRWEMHRHCRLSRSRQQLYFPPVCLCLASPGPAECCPASPFHPFKSFLPFLSFCLC